MFKILEYDIEKYQFIHQTKEIFQVDELSKIHITRPELFPDFELSFKNEVHTDFHKTFYDFINDENKNKEILKTYEDFIEEVVSSNFDESFCYQKFPSFRIHLPGKKAIHKWHFDNDDDHRHPEWEINFQISLTKMSDTQAMWIESIPGLKDFSPLNLEEGQFAIFDGNRCLHGNKPNTTDEARLSLDFRVIPISKYHPEKARSSATQGNKFVIGGYYKLWEKNNV